MISAKTTIIVPYYMREGVERHVRETRKRERTLERELPHFDHQREPTSLTLVKAWQNRFIPLPLKQVHQTELTSKIDEHFSISNKLKELPIQATPKSPAIKSIKELILSQINHDVLKELNIPSIKEVHVAFSELVKEHVRFHTPLWSPLSDLDPEALNNSDFHVCSQEQKRLIHHMRDLINKKKIKLGLNDQQKNSPGLDTHMQNSGMSASLKRLWNVEGDQSSHTQDTHPLFERALVLTTHEELSQLWGKDQTFILRKKANGKDSEIGQVKLERVLNVFMGASNGFLAYTFEILKCNELDQVQEVVYGLTRARSEYELSPFENPEWRDWHGELIPNVLRSGKFTLNDLTLWLTAISPKEVSGELRTYRTGDLRKWIHHTSIFLNKELFGDELAWARGECWKLARSVGKKRMYPLRVTQGDSLGSAQLYDDTLLETSVEGACAFTWKSQQGQFERERWALNEFHAIYLILHLHIRAEEMGLQDFSYKSLSLIKRLRPLTKKGVAVDLSRELKEMKGLILDMVYFNISFNSASAGGYSDHMSFLKELREVHSLEMLRDELKMNISELNELVERLETSERDERERVFNRNLSLLGAIAVPFGLISGLFGMNNFKVVNEEKLHLISFWEVMGLSVLLSIVLVFLILFSVKKRPS